MKQGDNKIPIAIMIGNGSKLPIIIKATKSPNSKFKICVVISHKKHSDGVEFALKKGIPAIYFNLVNWRKKTGKTRKEYSKYLGWFISQKNYQPKLLVFAGWDLILDNNFFKYFKSNVGDGYSAINLHPALMKLKGENEIILPDHSKIPVIKGEQEIVLKEVLKKNYSYFGVSIHYMNPKKFDTGQVIDREYIKVGKSKTLKQLHKKLMPIEDKILISSIKKATKNI